MSCSVSVMIHHEGTKGTKDTKERALVVSQAVLGGAIEVHRQLGPGLLESVYESALYRELWLRGLRVERQVPMKLTGHKVGLLINFNVELLRHGMRRVLNG